MFCFCVYQKPRCLKTSIHSLLSVKWLKKGKSLHWLKVICNLTFKKRVLLFSKAETEVQCLSSSLWRLGCWAGLGCPERGLRGQIGGSCDRWSRQRGDRRLVWNQMKKLFTQYQPHKMHLKITAKSYTVGDWNRLRGSTVTFRPFFKAN